MKSTAQRGVAGEWPRDGLEQVITCPVCKEEPRSLLYEDLEDEAFSCAPGKWALYRCDSCGSAYLDPRPTRESIGLAYKTYYTHGERLPTILPQGSTARSWLSAVVKNSYLHARYGVVKHDVPRIPPGIFQSLGKLFPILPQLDRWARHLPLPDQESKLLDVGCGNGFFLQIATFIGWDATGVDIDPKAVETARKLRLNAFESDLYTLPAGHESFDIVTINHVIEHLHDPILALQEARRILKPGGVLWVGTPNLNSTAHFAQGATWLGLDPPRHLVMFCDDSLKLAFERAGFPHPIRRQTARTDGGDWELIVTAHKPET